MELLDLLVLATLMTLLPFAGPQFLPQIYSPAGMTNGFRPFMSGRVSAPAFPAAVPTFGARSAAACAVANLRMEPSLNLRAFMGQWYFIDDIGLSSADKVNPAARPSDVKAFFTLNPDGTITVYTTGRRGFSTTCRNQIGLGRSSGVDSAKLLLSYPNAETAEERSSTPYWVAWTDYQSALVYSCRRMLPDGTCDPSATFSWTLSRDPCGHRLSAECAIVQKRLELCLPPRFRPMDKAFSCPRVNPYTFVENTPGAMALPGSPLFNPETFNPNRPVDGPERYVCRVATNNPIPNPRCPVLNVGGAMNGFPRFVAPRYSPGFSPAPAPAPAVAYSNVQHPFMRYVVSPIFR